MPNRVPLYMLLIALAWGGCQLETNAPEPPPSGPVAGEDTTATPPGTDEERVRTERVLSDGLSTILAHADSIESALRPVSLLTTAQARVFDRYRNDDHLVVARRIGVPQPVTAEARESLLSQGRLVRLDDSEFWTVRDLDHSTPLVTPDVVALLTEIGERFQARLAALGVPPLRLEVTSVLRTAEDQAELRRVNRNATRGESTHQYGTTVDIAYSSFRPPAEPVLRLDTAEAPWLEPYLRRMEAAATEAGAARMSRELQAELAIVLREMQSEGKVMVTMEVRQPVFHITVARTY